jgi:glutamate racemase
LKKADLDIKVIGVINAGVKGAFEIISKEEDFSIAVMATEGTVLSNGYVNAINDFIKTNEYKGIITIFQQAGVGLAGAIDGVSDYISSSATLIRKEYKGPSLSNANAKIDKIILSRYNFDWESNRILFTGEKNNPIELQLNSIENYIYYNVVSLLEQIRKSETAKPLKTIILGCTHYPFYTTIFEKKLNELYNYKENGEYVYRKFMKEEITLIDPAVNTAKELYAYLNENDLFNNSSMDKSEFYISVPNILNENVKTDSAGNFTYEYKYGRDAGNIQQYVKRVPFNKSNLHPDVIEMLKEKTPLIYQLIIDFNQKNEKTYYLRENNLGLL